MVSTILLGNDFRRLFSSVKRTLKKVLISSFLSNFQNIAFLSERKLRLYGTNNSVKGTFLYCVVTFGKVKCIMVWMKFMKVLAVTDVLVAAVLMTVYVSLLSEHLPELQMIQGSKSYHLVVYMYVSLCTIVQLLVAFKFYQVLTIPRHDKDEIEIEDLMSITKIWIFASYVLLINWVLKAGIYAQRCNCTMSVALAVYLVEISFRLCAICIGSSFLKKLEKFLETKNAQIKLQSVMSSFKHRKCDAKRIEV